MVNVGPTDLSSVAVPTVGFYGSGTGIYDLIDLGMLKDDLGITDGSADPFLKRTISRTSQNMRRYCGRTFQSQGYVERFWAYRDPYPWQLPGGYGPLQVSQFPIVGIPSLAGTAPPLPSTLGSAAGGNLAQQNCFVRTTFVTPTGETGTSTEQNLIIAPNNMLTVGAPLPDPIAVATGWNLYASTSAGTEVLQNANPMSLSSSWTEPGTGLIPVIDGVSFPTNITVTEDVSNVATSNAPTNLAEGIDYVADYAKGQLTRLFSDGYPRRWPALPLVVQYWAGYTKDTLPLELQDVCSRLCKGQYYARQRDPMIRAENVAGALETTYWFASGPGSDSAFPPDIAAILDQYRVPVIG